MDISVNGEKQALEGEKLTVTELIQLNKVKDPDMVSVQLNGEFVERAKYPETAIKNGDEIDFLYFMGGGSLYEGI